MSKTNVELVTELMEQSNNPMMQAFVIEAIQRYAAQIKDVTPEQWENGFISLDVWQDCANKAFKAIDERG